MGFRITRYEGISEPYSHKDKHTHALEYGPLLMAIKGESISKGQITLPFPASELIGKLQPEDEHSIHFKVTGAGDESLHFVPYYEIEKEAMTCLVFFTGD
jgi:hypothetical protein